MPASLTAIGFAIIGLCCARCSDPALLRCKSDQFDDSSVVYASHGITELKSDGLTPALQVLDYGHLVEGFPVFEVVSADGDTSTFEMTYSDTMSAVDLYHGDGPFALAGTMETYRVNKYNISNTANTVYRNRLVQGGFRYQKLNLSSAGTLKLQNIGVEPTTSTTPLTELPGSFSCSDVDLNRIWYTGARTSQMTQFIANTIPPFWQIGAEGAFVESAAPQYQRSVRTVNYTLEFEVKPTGGGFAFLVSSDTLNEGIYINCNVVDGTITAHKGSTEVAPVIASERAPISLNLGIWYKVRTSVGATAITVAINSQVVANFEVINDAGSFGVGAAYGHSAYFRNFNVTTFTGKSLYSSPCTNASCLDDFFLGTNPRDTLIDGSKRDRIAYLGDIDMGAGSAFATNWGASFVNGSINLLGSFQASPGMWLPSAKIVQLPYAGPPIQTELVGLIGHSFNFITSMCIYYKMQGDIGFAKNWGPKMAKMFDWAHNQTLPNGLFNVSTTNNGYDWNHYDPPQQGTITKFNAAYAYSLTQAIPLLKDTGVDTSKYLQHLTAVRAGLNNELWSEEIGAYVMSNSLRVGFGQDANAIAILAGVPQSANRSVSALLSNMNSSLVGPLGPMAFSEGVVAAGWHDMISPFASGYHLRAAFKAHDGPAAMTLLKTVWAPLANPNRINYTDTFWEVLNSTGAPGLGLWTSAAHGFSAAPTAELSQNVLGIQPVTPGFKEWQVMPQTLGLQWAKGRHPVHDGYIAVDWKFSAQGLLTMCVKSPKGTMGTIYLPEPMMVSPERTVIKVNHKTMPTKTFKVIGGQSFTLTQSLKKK